MARLENLDGRAKAVVGLLGRTEDWPAAQRLEAELICDAAEGYRSLPEILERYDGFIWTAVKQGPALVRRLASLPTRTASATRVLDNARAFDASFRPAEMAGGEGCLTDRERALLRLLPSHLSYAEMAAELHLSVNTVKSNLKALYRKLGATTRSEAVERAVSQSRAGTVEAERGHRQQERRDGHMPKVSPIGGHRGGDRQ